MKQTTQIMTPDEIEELKFITSTAMADALSELASEIQAETQRRRERATAKQPGTEKLDQHDVAEEPPKNLKPAEQVPPKYFLLDSHSGAAARFLEASRYVQLHSALAAGTDGVTIISSTAPVEGAPNVLSLRVNPKAPNAEAIAVALAVASGATLVTEQAIMEMAGQPVAKLARYEKALHQLARLGNGPDFGNSKGNVIAREALNL